VATTRLAPSPTGALHLGNARSFGLCWLLARATGARLLLRIEDLDHPRVRASAIPGVLEDLTWLGLDWDGPWTLQSDSAPAHEEALSTLIEDGRVYPCVCSRREVESAQSAPHVEDEVRYPGTCRGRFAGAAEAFAATGRPIGWRFRVESAGIAFVDEWLGPCVGRPADVGGDFVVAREHPDGRREIAYQLAVVVDDARTGVDWVIRGDDLLSSVPRQRLLQEALGLPSVRTAHLPLVVGPDGRRLAKRHGDTRIAAYREAGVPPEVLRAWIARSAGLPAAAFTDPARHPPTPVGVALLRVVVPPHDPAGGPPGPTWQDR
jgi:glutamyl-tRNA synthetase